MNVMYISSTISPTSWFSHTWWYWAPCSVLRAQTWPRRRQSGGHRRQRVCLALLLGCESQACARPLWGMRENWDRKVRTAVLRQTRVSSRSLWKGEPSGRRPPWPTPSPRLWEFLLGSVPLQYWFLPGSLLVLQVLTPCKPPPWLLPRLASRTQHHPQESSSFCCTLTAHPRDLVPKAVTRSFTFVSTLSWVPIHSGHWSHVCWMNKWWKEPFFSFSLWPGEFMMAWVQTAFCLGHVANIQKLRHLVTSISYDINYLFLSRNAKWLSENSGKQPAKAPGLHSAWFTDWKGAEGCVLSSWITC